VEVVASLSQGRTAAAQCGFFTYKSVPVIFEPPCTYSLFASVWQVNDALYTDALGDNNDVNISTSRRIVMQLNFECEKHI